MLIQKKIKTIQELQEFFPELIAITDGTEQPIPRPKNKKKRKTHYSGKKKRHTIKNQITINLNGEIIHKPPHSPGRRNDYAIVCLSLLFVFRSRDWLFCSISYCN